MTADGGGSPALPSLRRFLRFGPEDERALARLLPALPQHVERIIADFYDRILDDEAARTVLREESRVEGLKHQLRAWLVRVLSGPFDDEYYALRTRIGRRHVEVGLPQRFMPLAMNVVRTGLKQMAAAVHSGDREARDAAWQAIDKVLALELTIMLESYQEDARERLRLTERAATIAQLATAVGHELKNPLGVINTNLLLLREAVADLGHDAPPAAMQRALVRIARASRMAADLSTQLIEYTRRKERGGKSVPLREVVDEALQRVDAGQVRITATIDPEDAELTCQPDDLARVLANLLRNAIQSTVEQHRGGTDGVALAARVEPDAVVFEVSDHGPGVPAELRERIFEPLFTTRASGTGLGLAICRDIVGAHGGTIEVGEPGDGGPGAVFRVRLPRRPAS
jgi:signal transduction histidine kinase